jgi:signal transduction histidine kinase/ActR/RegA family two-component response regulator
MSATTENNQSKPPTPPSWAVLSRAVLELNRAPASAKALHQTIVRVARELVGAEFAGLLLRAHPGEAPSLAAIASPRLVVSEVTTPEASPPRKPGQSATDATLVGKPVFPDAASRIAAPLVADSHMLGTLVVATDKADAFGHECEPLLTSFADHAAEALRRLRETPPALAGHTASCELIQSLPEGVALCDDALRVREANDAFLRICQRTLRDVQEQPADDLLYRLSILGSQTSFWARLRADGRQELDFRNPAGRRSFSLRGTRLSRVAGGGYVLILRETTARDAVQERRLQSEKVSALGQVLSKMANQLNNPFQSVIGFADLLARRVNDPEAVEAVRMIQREGKRTAHVLKSLMLYSRRVQPEPARLNVNPFLEGVVREWQSHAPTPAVHVAVTLPTLSPQVHADAFQIEQVLRHLLDHAHRALAADPPAGGPRITVTAAAAGSQVEFILAYNGKPVPPHELRGVFEPKFHLPADSRETGLELTVCRDVVEAHGGRLSCESGEGQDTVFTFRLPALEGPVTAMFRRDDGAACAGRVLVIDDEPAIGALLREALRVECYEPECFTSAKEALRRLDSASFDLIVCDLNMPEMNGKEFYRQLRQAKPEMASRVIFATGDLISDHPDLFPEGHPHDVLPKPFRLDQLFTTLERKRRAHVHFAAAD